MPSEASRLVANHPLVGQLHDKLLDDARGNLASAYDEAVCWLAEMYEEIQLLKSKVSAGYDYQDTTPLYATRVEIKIPWLR